MNPICDLHTHSVFSDGTDTPAQIIHAAREIGLSAVALCDHNTVDGVPEFLEAAEGQPIQAIAGGEFSVDYRGTELHLLGLFIPEGAFPPISRQMQEAIRRKEESNIALVERLDKAGYHLDYAAIKARSPKGKINRAHIAAELTARGYTPSISRAFDTLLSKTGGFYTEPERICVFEMIRFLRELGALPVLAHPFLNLSPQALVEFLPEAKGLGLVGMECEYSLYSREQMEISRQIAGEFGLLPSGGSDYHGANKPDIRLGFGKGNLRIPYDYAAALNAKL